MQDQHHNIPSTNASKNYVLPPPSYSHDNPVQPLPACIDPQFSKRLPTPEELSKHISSLKVRLDFARFKLSNGWENNTLLDVELLWKKRQRQLYNEIPKPRFTQQDILDKRTQALSARAAKAKAKRASLTRTLSSPSLTRQDRKRKHRPSLHAFPNEVRTDSDTALCTNIPKHPNNDEPIRNSLDFLSYAIAMTEGQTTTEPAVTSSSQPQPDVSHIEPNLFDEQEDGPAFINNSRENDSQETWSFSNDTDPKQRRSSDARSGMETESDGPSPPSSPVTAAAQAIMMFVNDHFANTDKHQNLYS